MRKDDEESSGCLIPLLLFAVAVAAGGYCLHRFVGFDKFIDRFRPRQQKEVKIIDPSLLHKPAPPEPPRPDAAAATNDEAVVDEASSRPRKTIAQLREETDAAQAVLDLEIAKARATAGNALPSFAGIRFGDILSGEPLALEKLPSPATGGDDGKGLCCRMFGPKLPKPFKQFGTQPLVFATPKSRKAFRIEFTRAITRQPGWKTNPDTTNLVNELAGKLKCRAFSLDAAKYPLGKREFVFPIAETTLTVGEYGGVQLKLIVEHAKYRALALSETDAVRLEAQAEAANAKALASGAYPNAGTVKFGRIRMKKGTPKSFCGIVFGSLPPYSATSATPASSAAAHCFYVDYRKAKCDPFMTFDHGKAELSRINGAVIAVSLFSNGPDNGLTDAEYFARIRQAIEQRFKVSPASSSGNGPVQSLVYNVGSLTISLGPDPRGGFCLKAENSALKEAW